ncbi:DNA-dependent helicase II [Anatilimnocola aggregata]|uniref:DNA 3'-5' helicase n=2 Tax=Anatilimnocola aggregata TaxID=2528021 RepID=A0A517Y7Q9_9BACT|nr:DNA-dependent helicase II [Anatilimnocola aggregata]
MRTLPRVSPTPEQLPLITNTRPGVVIIRGAAGSGKTTTALLRLKQLSAFWLARREREQITTPVRVLVITYNRTLRGYIADLAAQQIIGRANLDMEILTFAKWAKGILGNVKVVDPAQNTELVRLCGLLPLPTAFVQGEVDYLLGRFIPTRLSDYLTCRRDGRGAMPRVDRAMRQRILDEVVAPYLAWKREAQVLDWNDLAIQSADVVEPAGYDVIISDEVQDLSANQVRALMHFANDPSSVTFVLDAAQRIYPRGFTWAEAGVEVSPANSHRLSKNYRNTKEICQFALPLLNGLEIGDDGTFPNFDSCTTTGPKPIVLKGLFRNQVQFAINYLAEHVDLSTESVAFLHAKGWFDFLKQQLDSNSYSYITITRQSEWPPGDENIALSTMSSAKGLEFDYVFLLGLSDDATIGSVDVEDSQLENLRRLFAMSITRARKAVVVGYKPTEESHLLSFLQHDTFEAIDV